MINQPLLNLKTETMNVRMRFDEYEDYREAKFFLWDSGLKHVFASIFINGQTLEFPNCPNPYPKEPPVEAKELPKSDITTFLT